MLAGKENGVRISDIGIFCHQCLAVRRTLFSHFFTVVSVEGSFTSVPSTLILFNRADGVFKIYPLAVVSFLNTLNVMIGRDKCVTHNF